MPLHVSAQLTLFDHCIYFSGMFIDNYAAVFHIVLCTNKFNAELVTFINAITFQFLNIPLLSKYKKAIVWENIVIFKKTKIKKIKFHSALRKEIQSQGFFT